MLLLSGRFYDSDDYDDNETGYNSRAQKKTPLHYTTYVRQLKR